MNEAFPTDDDIDASFLAAELTIQAAETPELADMLNWQGTAVALARFIVAYFGDEEDPEDEALPFPEPSEN